MGHIRFLSIYQSGKGKEAHFVHCIHDTVGCVFVDDDKALYTEIKHFIPGYKPFNPMVISIQSLLLLQLNEYRRTRRREGVESEEEEEADDVVPSKKKTRDLQNKVR